MLLRWFLPAVLLLSAPAQATYVALLVQENADKITDHVHVAVFDDETLEYGSELNIWNNEADSPTSLREEILDSSKFIVFYDEKAREDIVKDWTKIYQELVTTDKDKRSLLSKNCAWAVRQLLHDSLGFHFDHRVHFPRVIGGLSLPTFLNPIPIPETQRLRLKDALRKQGRMFLDEKDFRDWGQIEFFNKVRTLL